MEAIDLPDIHVTQRAAYNDTLELYEDDEATRPVDLTGITFVGEIRAAKSKSSQLLGAVVLTVPAPATAGKLDRHIHAADAALLPLGACWYDIKGTPQGGEAEVWFKGKIVVSEGVTA